MRSGDVLRVGQTEMMLHCNSGGLVSRSRGLPMESDAVWALRLAAERLFEAGAGLWGLVGHLRGRFLWFLAALGVIGLAWAHFRPAWAEPVWYLLHYIFYWMRSWVYDWTGF